MSSDVDGWAAVESFPACIELLRVAAHHTVHDVVAVFYIYCRVLFLVHVLVLRSYVGRWADPIVGTDGVHVKVVVLQYTAALSVPCTPSVVAPFHTVVRPRMVGWECIVVVALAGLAATACTHCLLSPLSFV